MNRNDLDGVTPSKELLTHAEHTETQYEDVKCLKQLRKVGEGYKVCLEWEGLPDTCDYT